MFVPDVVNSENTGAVPLVNNDPIFKEPFTFNLYASGSVPIPTLPLF